jgi:hypothetical protein
MQNNNSTLADLQHIKNMMERSSRFISLSGLSGLPPLVAASICAAACVFNLRLRWSPLQSPPPRVFLTSGVQWVT